MKNKMKLGVSFFSLLILLSLILTRSYLSLAALVAAHVFDKESEYTVGDEV